MINPCKLFSVQILGIKISNDSLIINPRGALALWLVVTSYLQVKAMRALKRALVSWVAYEQTLHRKGSP